MLIQQQFANFRAILEATLRDSAKGQMGYAKVGEADDALRVLEDHMNALDNALLEIHQAIKREM